VETYQGLGVRLHATLDWMTVNYKSYAPSTTLY
jgi:hypothetical protein